MGNCCSVEGAVDHWIYIQTGDFKDGAIDANCKVVLHDDKGNKSSEIPITINFKGEMSRSKTDFTQAPPLYGFGEIILIEFWRDDDGVKPDWFCEVIVVNDRKRELAFYFPVQKWVRDNYHYVIPAFDTSLPQADPYPEQRNIELDEKSRSYAYGQQAPDMPVQILSVPAEEVFSGDYLTDVSAMKNELLSKSGLPRVFLASTPWNSLQELMDVYANPGAFPEPSGMGRWSNDLCFGAQRLIGCNPSYISLCTKLPENMGITAEMLRPFLEGWTLKQIIEAKRLYYVDLKILDNLPTKDDNPVCAPIALFFSTGEKQLVPIAIQLYQDIAPDNPVFLPNDAPLTWLLAKMWFNHADASVQQAITHIAYTHMVAEGICISMHRNLSPNHPVYRLLVPHFFNLLSLNARGLNKLLAPNGWIDRTFSIGREGMLELIRRGMDEWRFDVHANLPKSLERRGLLDPKTLPNYAYRDDAVVLHKVIENYVAKILRFYYEIPQKVKEDTELQRWAQEMAAPLDEGGVGLNGIPGRGNLRLVDDVVLICTGVIFMCTVQHAAVSYGQYDEYAFPPNYPSFLNGLPPADKAPKTEQDIVEALPPKNITVEVMAGTKIVSLMPEQTKTLGEMTFQYQYDPVALKAEKEFREELQEAKKMIESRNGARANLFKYDILNPDKVPNYIHT